MVRNRRIKRICLVFRFAASFSSYTSSNPGRHRTLCRAIFSQLRHASTIRKKLVTQQYVLHMYLQYGELRPTSVWDRFTSLGHPCKFQRLSRLSSVTARQSSSERQPDFAAMNRGRHLCSAGRPSRWTLAHISSYCHKNAWLFMVALWNWALWNICILLFLSSIFFSSPVLSGRTLDVYHISTHGVALVRI